MFEIKVQKEESDYTDEEFAVMEARRRQRRLCNDYKYLQLFGVMRCIIRTRLNFNILFSMLHYITQKFKNRFIVFTVKDIVKWLNCQT